MPAPVPEPDQATVYCHLAGVTNLAVAVGSTCLFTRALSIARDESGTPDPVTLAEEIRLSIDYYMAQPGAPAVGELVLPGRPRRTMAWSSSSAGLVAIPVRVPAPLENLDTSALPPVRTRAVIRSRPAWRSETTPHEAGQPSSAALPVGRAERGPVG